MSKLILCGDYLYEVMRFGVTVYRRAVLGDMPMVRAYGCHWQAIDTWAI